MRDQRSPRLARLRTTVLTPVALALFATLTGAPAPTHAQQSYGYFRTVEGSATLVQGATETRNEAIRNLPVQPGDRVLLNGGARLEVVLPDNVLLRLDDGAEIAFESLAGAADGASGSTRATLDRGRAQWSIPEAAVGEEPPRVDTPNATAYLQFGGSYLIESDWQFTAVTVRQGSAEVRTRRGSTLVRPGETATVDGDAWAQVELRPAIVETDLERWVAELDRAVEAAEIPREIDESLAYQAAPLDRYGSWVTVSGQAAWRPSVASGWAPYTVGRWAPSPSGLFWVSYEPWGWVPYHYGSWDFDPYLGWIWYPGARFAPAWVYWYWGPRFVGWCPTGFYTRFYGPRFHHAGFHFRFGHHGWAAGHWHRFKHWTFVPLGHVRAHDLGRFSHRSAAITREFGAPELERGLITTDTRAIGAREWADPRSARAALLRGAQARGADLPDVGAFVTRSGELEPNVARSVLTREPSEGLMRPGGGAAIATRRTAPSTAPADGGERRVQAQPGRFAPVDVTDGRAVPYRIGSEQDGSAWRRGPASIADGTRGVIARRPATDPQPGAVRALPDRRAPAGPDRMDTDWRRPQALPRAVSPRQPADSRGRGTERPTNEDWRRSPGSVRPGGPVSIDRTPFTRPSGPSLGREPVRRVIDGVRTLTGGPTSSPPPGVRPPVRRVTPAPGGHEVSPGRGRIQASPRGGGANSQGVHSAPGRSSRPAASQSAPSRASGSDRGGSSRGSASRSRDGG